MNRRSGVIGHIVYEDGTSPDLRPIPGAHRIALGLDLRLCRLKLIGECTQRATS